MKSPMFSHHDIAQQQASRRLLLRHGDDVVRRLEAAARGVLWAGGLEHGHLMSIFLGNFNGILMGFNGI